MPKKEVSLSVIRRLPRYFRYLNELEQRGIQRISSKELSERMHITASQIRQDLNCFGGFGQQGYGYTVPSLLAEIKKILGSNGHKTAVIVGLGNMGTALAKNMKFEKRGVFLTGLFDCSPDKIGKEVGGLTIQSIDTLETFCRDDLPDIAILTLPKDITRDMAQKLFDYGIRGFWNFASMEMDIPGATVETVHLGDSLMLLCYHMKEEQKDYGEQTD